MQRKTYGADFKAKVALEAVKGLRTSPLTGIDLVVLRKTDPDLEAGFRTEECV